MMTSRNFEVNPLILRALNDIFRENQSILRLWYDLIWTKILLFFLGFAYIFADISQRYISSLTTDKK